MKIDRTTTDAVLARLMSQRGDDAQDDDGGVPPDDAPDDTEDDPRLVAASELLAALQSRDPSALADAFQTMIDACSSGSSAPEGHAFGGRVGVPRPRVPRVGSR